MRWRLGPRRWGAPELSACARALGPLAVATDAHQCAAMQVDVEPRTRTYPLPAWPDALERLGRQGHHGATAHAVTVQVAFRGEVVTGCPTGQTLLDHDPHSHEPFQGPIDGSAVHRPSRSRSGEAARDFIGTDVR